MLTIIIIKKSIYLIILFVLGFIAVVPAVAEMRLQFSLEILHMQFNKYQINIFKYPTSKLQQQCRAVVVFVKVLKSKTAVVLQIICTFAALCWFYNATAAEPKTGLTVTFKKKLTTTLTTGQIWWSLPKLWSTCHVVQEFASVPFSLSAPCFPLLF